MQGQFERYVREFERLLVSEQNWHAQMLIGHEEKLSLKLPLWWWPWESWEDNGSSLISLFGLLV